MDGKENMVPETTFQMPLGISSKVNLRGTGIASLSSDIEAEK